MFFSSGASKIDAARDASEPIVPNTDTPVGFGEVLRSEVTSINARRDFLSQKFTAEERWKRRINSGAGEQKAIDAVGLALSGGGIRSAAFCLGALQGLDAVQQTRQQPDDGEPVSTLLERVDYLSTVSGGGYIGSSLSAGLAGRAGQFPFRSLLDKEETLSIKHFRDHSNYLFSRGFIDILDSVAIYLRGLLANIVIILAPILLLVTFTLYCNPDRNALTEPKLFRRIVAWLFPYGPPSALPLGLFAFSKLIAVFVLILFLLWGVTSIVERWANIPILQTMRRFGKASAARSRRVWRYAKAKFKHFFRKGRKPSDSLSDALFGRMEVGDFPVHYSEANSRWARVGGWMLALLLICVFCELQPWVLEGIFDYAAKQQAESNPVTGVGFWYKLIVAALSAVAAFVGAFADKIEKLTKKLGQDGWIAKAGHYSVRGFIYLSAAAVPLLLWAAYILLCFWGIRSEIFCSVPGPSCEPSFAAPIAVIDFSQATFGEHVSGGSLTGLWAGIASGKLWWVKTAVDWVTQLPILPGIFSWISSVVMLVSAWAADRTTVIGGTYILIAIILLIFSLLPTLNANSLHRLYRDRLSTAFIFYERLPAAAETPVRGGIRGFFAMRAAAGQAKSLSEPRPKTSGFIVALDQMKLSALSGLCGPYHIINTALNIQGSKYANQRGRNADFFMFTRNYVGSEATQYAATRRMESVAPDLNLATAMAVSGAAASSNMGSSTIRPLTPTLSIVNVRLGYWLRNPRAAVGIGAGRVTARIAEWTNMYFFKEMLGRLDEKTNNVYLTDGGHIENLGLYELLKRRCRLIIAIDAEADPHMNFGSFVKLQRHARIDLGTRIELPWQAVRNHALETSQMVAAGGKDLPDSKRCGPHAALGIIRYPNDEIGYLLYVKASLSGDENDYVLDYCRRNPTFPHETTSDQLFTEEQFEVYRTLGFHAVHRVFTGEDKVSSQAADSSPPRLLNWTSRAKQHNPMPDVRAVLSL